jgi:transcriptional regulator with XRE-family HTH domain
VSTTEKQLSTSKLASSKEYREAFVAAFLKRYIPFQIRTIRKHREMSQQQLADASKLTQGVISRAEDSDYGNLTFNTVLRIAAGFDLVFVGKFVRFSELVGIVGEMSEESLALPSFSEECEREAADQKVPSAQEVFANATSGTLQWLAGANRSGEIPDWFRRLALAEKALALGDEYPQLKNMTLQQLAGMSPPPSGTLHLQVSDTATVTDAAALASPNVPPIGGDVASGASDLNPSPERPKKPTPQLPKWLAVAA